jgi:hypothetical protein
MRRQIRQDLLVTKWHPSMHKTNKKKIWFEGSSAISVYIRKQMNLYSLGQVDIVRNDDISFGTLKHLLVYTKGRVTINVIKRLSLALASAVPDKDYLEFLYETLEATNQIDRFPLDQINTLKSIILSKE